MFLIIFVIYLFCLYMAYFDLKSEFSFENVGLIILNGTLIFIYLIGSAIYLYVIIFLVIIESLNLIIKNRKKV